MQTCTQGFHLRYPPSRKASEDKSYDGQDEGQVTLINTVFGFTGAVLKNR